MEDFCLTEEEFREVCDDMAQRWLGMSFEDFIAADRAGKMSSTPAAEQLRMLGRVYRPEVHVQKNITTYVDWAMHALIAASAVILVRKGQYVKAGLHIAGHACYTLSRRL